MAVATKEMKVGQELPTVRKEVTKDRIRLFGWWAMSNVHTDWGVASNWGVPGLIANGSMSKEFIAEMLIQFFGLGFLKGGELDVTYIRYILPGDTITAKGVIREKLAERAVVRFNIDVWCENQRGEKVTVGTATCLLPK